MPIDTLKTVSQVEGRKGFDAVFRHSIRKGNVRNLYTGSYAMFLATLIGHYPWFATYNVLQRIVPRQEVRAMQMLRSAVIGFTSSIVSDVTSNPIRVVKTTKQSSAAKTALKLEAPRRRRDGRESITLREYCFADREGGRRPGVLYARPVDAHSGERRHAVDRVLGRLAAAV